MTGKKKLPIGIDIFEKLDREEFYYVDKTVDLYLKLTQF